MGNKNTYVFIIVYFIRISRRKYIGRRYCKYYNENSLYILILILIRIEYGRLRMEYGKDSKGWAPC